MNVPRDPDEILSAWLDEGPDRLPDPTRRAIAVAIPTTSQRRSITIRLWRSPQMQKLPKIALGTAAVVVVALGGAFLLGPPASGLGVGGPKPPPSTAPPSVTPSATIPGPSSSPSRVAEVPIDTATWTTYVSKRYGFSMGHPADWTEVPASRPWTFEADADDPLAPGADSFFTPVGGGVRVSAWPVAVDPDTTIGGWAELEAWVEDYCRKTNNAPCTGIHERAVPLCNEKRDCHPGLLVPFKDDVQAFFGGGGSDPMTVVAVWRPESDPSVAQFGGSRRLLEAILTTMNVWLPSGPDNHP
jgi:hypothetical protein